MWSCEGSQDPCTEQLRGWGGVQAQGLGVLLTVARLSVTRETLQMTKNEGCGEFSWLFLTPPTQDQHADMS